MVCPEAIGWDISPLANALARMDEQEYKTFFFECLTGRRNDYENSIKEMKIKTRWLVKKLLINWIKFKFRS